MTQYVKPTGVKLRPIVDIEKISKKFVIRESGCWEWVGHLSKSGYGVYCYKFAHRILWELTGNPVDLTLVLDHLCRNRKCVNPKHLEQVTIRTNVLRGFNPAAINARRKYCINGHEKTPENMYSTEDKKRNTSACKECRRLRHIKYSAIISQRRAAIGAVRGILRIDQVLIIDVLKHTRKSAEVAKMYGVSQNTIRDIWAGRRWAKQIAEAKQKEVIQ